MLNFGVKFVIMSWKKFSELKEQDEISEAAIKIISMIPEDVIIRYAGESLNVLSSIPFKEIQQSRSQFLPQHSLNQSQGNSDKEIPPAVFSPDKKTERIREIIRLISISESKNEESNKNVNKPSDKECSDEVQALKNELSSQISYKNNMEKMFSSVVHEFKTPINAFVNATTMLKLNIDTLKSIVDELPIEDKDVTFELNHVWESSKKFLKT